MERKILDVTKRYMKRAAWIRKLIKTEDILTTIKKKWAWAGHIARRNDIKKKRQWQPRNYKRTRRKNVIALFAGAKWRTLTSNR